jgi:trk system potassium uptake protein
MAKRQRFVVIGIGNFGAYVARTLFEADKEVIAIDADASKVEAARDFATQAVIADATDKEALSEIGVADADAAIVSLGARMDVITLAALQVKELGVPYIAVKALSEDHGKILQAIGIHNVIHPEKDAAIRLGTRLALRDVVEFLPVLPGYSITEVKAPPEFVGKSLRELALRNTLNVQLVAIQHAHAGGKAMNIVPRAEDVIHEGDLLFLLGENRHLDNFADIVRNKAPK